MSMNVHRLNHASLNVAWLNRVGEPMSACKGADVYWEEATYSGNDILFIKDMKFNSITKLALGGGCLQSGTPTPTAPLDIITNKGAIKLTRGKNLLEVKDDNIVVGRSHPSWMRGLKLAKGTRKGYSRDVASLVDAWIETP